MENENAEALAKEILKEAKREAKRIIDEAKRSIASIDAKDEAPVPITPAESYDSVELELFRGSGEYSEPMAVKWGGRQFLIPRGVRVTVPAPVAEIIRISDEQEIMTADLIRRLEATAE